MFGLLHWSQHTQITGKYVQIKIIWRELLGAHEVFTVKPQGSKKLYIPV